AAPFVLHYRRDCCGGSIERDEKRISYRLVRDVHTLVGNGFSLVDISKSSRNDLLQLADDGGKIYTQRNVERGGRQSWNRVSVCHHCRGRRVYVEPRLARQRKQRSGCKNS